MKLPLDRKTVSISLISGVALMLAPLLADAHIGTEAGAGFARGLEHPLGGLDHVLAMVAVGLWAAQRGGRAVWLMPATFVALMAVGGIAGMSGLSLPFVEHGILLSVLVLGVLVTAAVRLPLYASAMIVGLFALFHGHAHGTAMPADALGLAYGLGFALVTAGLHGAGIGIALLTRAIGRMNFVRYCGGAIAACAVSLWIAA